MDDLQLIERSSNFTLRLLRPDEARDDPCTAHKTHKTFLLPLLALAEECWAYGVTEGSPAEQSAGDILKRDKGKHRIDLSGDPVTGREFFWNASGGERGTIVVVVPLLKLKPERLFSACEEAFVFENYRSGHTPAAIRLAQSKISTGTHVAFCLPRNNGFEWVEVFAPKPQVFELYAQALQCIKAA